MEIVCRDIGECDRRAAAACSGRYRVRRWRWEIRGNVIKAVVTFECVGGGAG